MATDADLPVEAVIPELLATLRQQTAAIVIAPPGAGKTTAIAPRLIDEPWCDGKIMLLTPRRLAARGAAEHMATLRGERPGQIIGYRTRLDSRISDATRIEVVTEGIFRNLIQMDPELSGISAVIFDEAHERSLEGDSSLALALDSQGALRPDLRLLIMSATLDGEAYARILNNAPIIRSEGRSYPLAYRYCGRAAEERIEDAMARAIKQALRQDEGDILAFLPGVGEIERTAERLEGLANIETHRLHGNLAPAEQQAALKPGKLRKVVLATSIAETSLTIDGVRVVVDSGLTRRPRYDRASGLTRLSTEKLSQASAAQRAGRAGRQAPGVAYRLWDEQQTKSLPPFDPPEILEADLTGLMLDLALWGVKDPNALLWLDPPPPASIKEAAARLLTLDAIDDDWRPTEHGHAIAALPLPPRIAHMLIRARHRHALGTAARIAVLLGEKGIGGRSIDLTERLRRWRQARDKRSTAALSLARRWAKFVDDASVDTQSADKALAAQTSQQWPGDDEDAGLCIALAYPDRIAKRRSADGADWISVGGRGFRLDPADPLASAGWLAVAEAQGSAAGARIMAAAPIEASLVEELFVSQIQITTSAIYDSQSRSVQPIRKRSLGAITLARSYDGQANPEAISKALVEAVQKHGLNLINWPDEARNYQARVKFLQSFIPALADVSDAALLADDEGWLSTLLLDVKRLDDISTDQIMRALKDRLGWEHAAAVDRLAPLRLETAAGSSHIIDYTADGGPTVEVRVQAMFGLARHPMIVDGKHPLILALTSPARRPIQTTRNLPDFWAGSWKDVAKEMRGRYPRHPWPDDPAAASATLRTKKADQRTR